jgi:hypothetical protein
LQGEAGSFTQKTALHPGRAANDSGPYDMQTIVRNPDSLCRRGSSDFDLVRRQSNGCSTGDAQNDRDEQSWLLKPGRSKEEADHNPETPFGVEWNRFYTRLKPAWQISKDFCAMQAKSTEAYVCH